LRGRGIDFIRLLNLAIWSAPQLRALAIGLPLGESGVQADTTTSPLIRIGTRGSPLALAQAYEVRDRLMAAHGLVADALEIIVIKTTGDRILDRPLSEAGGKGLFTKEIEEALLDGTIDLAVHSMKDMPTALPAGTEIAALLPRADPRDAFISGKARTLADLPAGARVGTSSLRRQAQVLRQRPDLVIAPLRGNVNTRLARLEVGTVDATILAAAGLARLGAGDRATSLMPVEMMLPAVAQGAIGIEVRSGDIRASRLVAPISDEITARCIAAERSYLARLDGSCRTPIAGLAEIRQGRLVLVCEILAKDGARFYATRREGHPDDAERLGTDAAEELLHRAGPTFLGA